MGSYLSKKQKSWELKRDCAVGIMRSFGAIKRAAALIYDAVAQFNRSRENPAETDEHRNEVKRKYDEAYTQFGEAMTLFWQEREIARLVFRTVVYEKMGEIESVLHAYSFGLFDDHRQFPTLMSAVTQKQQELSDVVRRQL